MSIMNLTIYLEPPPAYKSKTCVCCNKPIGDIPGVIIHYTYRGYFEWSYYHLNCCVISCDKRMLSSINVF